MEELETAPLLGETKSTTAADDNEGEKINWIILVLFAMLVRSDFFMYKFANA